MTVLTLPTHACVDCGRVWALATRRVAFGEPCPDCGGIVLRADHARPVSAFGAALAAARDEADRAACVDRALASRRRRASLRVILGELRP